MTLENKVDFTVERKNIEGWFGRHLTDREWETFASEIEVALDDALETMSVEIFDDLANLVEQDKKYDLAEEDAN